MKRRDLILASAGLAVGLVPGLGRATQPCPPPQVGVSGGTTASTSCPVPPSGGGTGAYATSFSATENPISEGGKWINGLATGGDWHNVQTTPGKAFAGDFSVNPDAYNDSIAVLNTSFAANQYVQGTVYRAAGYGAGDNNSSHEIELLLRFSITSRVARGYEVLWSRDGGLAIVRWNGAYGNWVTIFDGVIIGMAADGDVLRAEISGSTIKVFKNGSLVATASDSTWTDGQPGMGFWPKPNATLSAYGWKGYQAGSL